jgi:trimethylamine monooxygenase
MQDQVFTFSMFDAQAWWVRDVILGKIPLPTKEQMTAESNTLFLEAQQLVNFEAEIRFQADYVAHLMSQTDYPKFDIDLVIQNFIQWDNDKKDSVVSYRDKSFTSAVDGAVAPQPSTQWIHSKENSVDAFLRYYEREAEL